MILKVGKVSLEWADFARQLERGLTEAAQLADRYEKLWVEECRRSSGARSVGEECERG